MARLTVEDCLEHVENRFQLVLVATKRARQLYHGKEPHLPWENDKPTVMALREIEEGYVTPAILDENAVAEAAAEPEETAEPVVAEMQAASPEEAPPPESPDAVPPTS